jgi:hypothetical protein
MRGLLFCKEMREAIRAGRKTVTRRLIKPQPKSKTAGVYADRYNHSEDWAFWLPDNRMTEPRVWTPRYLPGETVYVKEPWGIHPTIPGPIYYKDIGSSVIDKWKSPLFMPQWAARTFLKIESVRAERLNEITGDDAIAEGVALENPDKLAGKAWSDMRIMQYSVLWDSINPDHPWASNPWIFRYQFSKVTP